MKKIKMIAIMFELSRDDCLKFHFSENEKKILEFDRDKKKLQGTLSETQLVAKKKDGSTKHNLNKSEN